MKKLLALMLSSMLACSFVACAADNDGEVEGTPLPIVEDLLNGNSNMAKIIGNTLNDKVNPYTIIYKIDVDGVELEIIQAVKDDMVYMEFEYQGSMLKNLTDNLSGYHYAIYDSEKLVFKSTEPQMKIKPFENKYDQLKESFSMGDEEIDGVSYKYEKATGDAGYITIYLDASGKLCYIDANGTLMEIIAYDSTIDLAHFELPEDYMVMEG